MSDTQIFFALLAIAVPASLWLFGRLKTADDERLKALERRVDDLNKRMDNQSSEFRAEFTKLEAKLERMLDLILSMKGDR